MQSSQPRPSNAKNRSPLTTKLWTLEKGLTAGFAGNLYPGTFGVTEFGNFTSPNSSSYYFYGGNAPRFGYSGVTVSDIVQERWWITATFAIR